MAGMITIRLDSEVHARLKLRARGAGVSLNQLCLDAVAQTLLPENDCKWALTPGNGRKSLTFDAACGVSFGLADGALWKDSHIVFCPQCGRRVLLENV